MLKQWTIMQILYSYIDQISACQEEKTGDVHVRINQTLDSAAQMTERLKPAVRTL